MTRYKVQFTPGEPKRNLTMDVRMKPLVAPVQEVVAPPTPPVVATSKYGFVANTDHKSVSAFDLSTGTLHSITPVGDQSLVGDSALYLAMNAEETRLYVSIFASASVVVMDITAPPFTVVTEIIIPPLPSRVTHAGHVSLNPDESKLYVSMKDGGALAVIDTATNTLITQIDLNTVVADTVYGENPQQHAYSPDGTRLYVPCLPRSGVPNAFPVANVDCVADVLTEFFNDVSIPQDELYEPFGLVVSPDGNFVFVSDQIGSRVLVFTPPVGFSAYYQTLDVGSIPRDMVRDSDGIYAYVSCGDSRFSNGGVWRIRIGDQVVLDFLTGTDIPGSFPRDMDITDDDALLFVVLIDGVGILDTSAFTFSPTESDIGSSAGSLNPTGIRVQQPPPPVAPANDDFANAEAIVLA